MTTAYKIFFIVIIISFVTGNIVLYVEHKRKKEALLKKHILIDEDLL